MAINNDSIPLALALLEKLKEVGINDVTELIADDDEKEQKYDKEYIDELKSCCKSLAEKVNFQNGQIVKWKKHLQNKKLPKINQPAIVIATLESPLFEKGIPIGSTYYREPIDIILGIFHDDGNFLTFYHDSRRFELYKDIEE